MKQCEQILIISELKPLFLFPRKFLIYTTSNKMKNKIYHTIRKVENAS